MNTKPIKILSLDEFISLLVRRHIVHESAIEDPEGYDGGFMLNTINNAYEEIKERIRLANE